MLFRSIILSALIAWSAAASAQILSIGTGTHITASGNVSIVLKDAGLKNEGTFTPGNSTIYFDGEASTSISGTQAIDFYNVVFKGTGLKVNAGSGRVISTISAEGSTFDADGADGSKSFTLLSSDTATARVDILTTGDITGNVTVERYIHTGTEADQHDKSWQFLATPTTGQSVFQSWQENGLSPAGYGTWISGTGTGFDVTTVSASMKFYNAVSDLWTGITNTGNSLQNKLGYMLFVRGDRTVTTYNAPTNKTNMRSKGVLFTPSNPPQSVPVGENLLQSFGNPYASRIEFNKVYLQSTGINNVYYAWDPLLAGTYNVGGYQTISAVAGYIPTAGNGTSYYPAGVPAPYIESGQAVFVKGNTGGTVNFNENCKASGSRLVNRSADSISSSVPQERQLLFTTLIAANGKIADGNIVAFENGLGNEINESDAEKIINEGENFGLMRNDVKLAVEARNKIIESDTIFYWTKNLRQQDYQLMLVPMNFNQTISGFLIDRYTNTTTAVDFTDTTFISFSVNADPGSSAVDRLMLVFKVNTVLPVKILSLHAIRATATTNKISWRVDNETNVDRYEIEQSGNGITFTSIGGQAAENNNGQSVSYTFTDIHPHTDVTYYRIKVRELTNGVQLSKIVSVKSITDSPISIYPNPVKNQTINVTITEQNSGKYAVRLFNVAGQSVYETFMTANAGIVVLKLPMLAKGIYQMIFSNESKEYTIQLIID